MFRRLEQAHRTVTITVEGTATSVEDGANLAAVLVEAGFSPFRTTAVSGAPRAAYCMMGVCFECLAEIDGMPNRQTCLETVRDGMDVRRMTGAPDIGKS